MESNQAFEQSAFYVAIKSLLVKKGYLSDTEAASTEEWSLVHNASWNAYAANVLSLPGHLIPWNYESIPLALLEDADFVMEGAPDLSVIEGELQVAGQPVIAANPNDLEEDTDAGDHVDTTGGHTGGNTFRIDDGQNDDGQTIIPATPPVQEVLNPVQAPTEPIDPAQAPNPEIAEGQEAEGGTNEEDKA